ncbi:thiamine diphosphokinase [Evansella sp. AB-rgal1]|uniref:thiamine diphosphokinase n=1 Tax=Evansella sp. AB-rgal1 TaxID=3242696 RepID=UPI00359E33F7
MKYILLAAGPFEYVPPLSELKMKHNDAQWIGIDKGTFHLLKHGITPLHAFGDFDSLTVEEGEWVHSQTVHLSVYPKEKDATDMELALDWAISKKPDEIILLGATGGRLDHMLVNIQFLTKGLEKGVNIVIEDIYNRVTVKEPGEYTIHESEFPYNSFLPMSIQVEGLTLTGFRYPLENRTITQSSSLCISNELVSNKGTISFTSGNLLLFQTRD